MNRILSLVVLVSALAGANTAQANWQCTYSCGSKSHQEPKVGRGYSQDQAIRDAKRHTCTQYVGGRPQFFQGCEYMGDQGGNDGPGWSDPYNPPYQPPYREEWECVYSCGSKSHQEPKVGRGFSQRHAIQDAQRHTCTKYTGGRPQFYQGCRQL